LTFSLWTCSFLMRPWIVKNPYFVIPLSQPQHNGISYVASVWSFLPHSFLLYSSHIFSSDCIWLIL
jgi:hypothetical protein